MEAPLTTAVEQDASLTQDDASLSPDSTCEIRFLMVNGGSFHLALSASSTIHDVKQSVIDERPKGTISYYPFPCDTMNSALPVDFETHILKELMEFLKGSTPSVTTMPSKTDEIRILYLGKFLDDVKTLKECKFATGKDNLTVVHISVRVPTDASEDVKEKLNKKTSACCIIM